MVGFVICLIFGALIGAVGGTLNWLEQHGKAPWQKDGNYTSYQYRSSFHRSDETDSKPNSKKHSGKCDGDCANCPPHYGYRHGRWYYGHDHIEGCEFGGNKGSGGRD